MREINVSTVTDIIKRLCIEANIDLGDDVVKALEAAEASEVSPTGKAVLQQIIKNSEIARSEKLAICQDTGFTVVFLEIGQDVHFTGGDLTESIYEGVRQGYTEGYLRKSIVKDPITTPVNTGDNTPAVVHLTIVPGDKVKIIVAPKGGGSENMSEVKMMKPADGLDGLKSFVINKVLTSGGNPCPPIIVGIGVGGTFEYTAYLAKKAAIREVGVHNPDPKLADLERELLEEVNKLGIGPMGFGGRTTALAVNIEVFPRHIATFPVAVNLNCHVIRHKSAEI
ncbi:fumarate hydratase [Candidatus Dependentiae bacterium]|nr:fumarate hydratase [Candidatus Dependentiae bacterium]